MLDKEITIRRLAIVKYLYTIAVQQSMQVETVAGFSILSFHDCAEMFLLLIAENKNLKAQKWSFKDYWTHIPELTLQNSMNALKDRRVSIKHKGQFPSKSDIELSRLTITQFLEENTSKQFGVEFKEISTSSLIYFKSVKDYIDIAEQKYQSGEIYECLKNCKFAFEELLRSYEANKSSRYSFNNILNIGDKISNNYNFLVGNHNRDSRWFEDVTKTTNKLRNVLKITALGIDYRKYVFFEAITPYIQVWHKKDGCEYNAIGKELYEQRMQPRNVDCRFCIDFVIDSALKLQDFDFNLTSIYKK
jgi:hypothetical protein B2_16713